MVMKLTQLSSKPQLVKITLDSEEIITKYGDSLEFWIMDRQPIDEFVKMATAGEKNYVDLIKLCNQMILDEEGNPAIAEGEALPNGLVMPVIGAVIERLGK